MSGNDFHVDLCKNRNDIIVVTDPPSISKEDISIHLLNPETLIIKIEQHAELERTGEKRIYHLRECRLGSMQRCIHLPAAVKTEREKASFKNGVMELTLQKGKAVGDINIDIE
ncbi:MAG: Hsp20/alpha crystallin family protein [Methanocalculaceae archaeon]|jgi:HSP20 family protein|nr:Hsp20/alpha crystallin family protein [Methanocalculaceae archaeon]